MLMGYMCPSCFKKVIIENEEIESVMYRMDALTVDGDHYNLRVNQSCADDLDPSNYPRIYPVSPYEVVCDCGEVMVHVDPRILPAVQMLNKIGLSVATSSQGRSDKVINLIGYETATIPPYIEFSTTCNPFFVEMEDRVKSLLQGHELTYSVNILEHDGDDKRVSTVDISSISLKELSNDKNKEFYLTLTTLPTYIGSHVYHIIPSKFENACMEIIMMSSNLCSAYDDYIEKMKKKEEESKGKDLASSVSDDRNDHIKLYTSDPLSGYNPPTRSIDVSDDEMDMF